MTAAVKSAAYQLLEWASRGQGVRRSVCGEAFRLPARWSRYFGDTYEPDTFAFLREHCRTGQTALDVGAYVGLFSVLMARQVGPAGRVVSFEPTDNLRCVVDEMVRINRCENVEVRPEAVAGQTGTLTFHTSDVDTANSNSLIDRPGHGNTISVSATTIDDFLRDRGLRVDCLKIDVEGAEQDVLRGAADTFVRCRPAASIAIHPPLIARAGGSLDDIWTLLAEYRMQVYVGGQPVDRAWFRDQHGLFDAHAFPA